MIEEMTGSVYPTEALPGETGETYEGETMAETPPAKEGSSIEESGALADSDLVEEAVPETASSDSSAPETAPSSPETPQRLTGMDKELRSQRPPQSPARETPPLGTGLPSTLKLPGPTDMRSTRWGRERRFMGSASKNMEP